MAVSRLVYLTALGLCTLSYLAWGQWLHWLLLAVVMGLPWLSLALSIPAICRFRAAPAGADTLAQGMPGELCLLGSCSFPAPPFRGRLRLKNLLTGEQRLYKPEKGLATAHCGGFRVTVERARVCDYLGLFSFPVKRRESKTLVIRPAPLPIRGLEEPECRIRRPWRPKPGGGFSEDHELRPYRPGDSLMQLHWKLSAKTGTLILRQSIEPEQGAVVLTMNLSGDAGTLDRKFGRLSWLGARLLRCQIPFSLRVLTGEGLFTAQITSQEVLTDAMDRLLCSAALRSGDIREQDVSAAWHYHIGGDADG